MGLAATAMVAGLTFVAAAPASALGIHFCPSNSNYAGNSWQTPNLGGLTTMVSGSGSSVSVQGRSNNFTVGAKVTNTTTASFSTPTTYYDPGGFHWAPGCSRWNS